MNIELANKRVCEKGLFDSEMINMNALLVKEEMTS